MASCSKVMAGTTTMALLYQWGEYSLEDPVSKYLPGFEANGKEGVLIKHILLHNSGMKADPWPGYATKEFGCEEMQKEHPDMVFTCRTQCYKGLLQESLSYTTGEGYTYSDLNFMTVMNIVGVIARDKGYVKAEEIRDGCPIGDEGDAQCYYEAFFRKYVTGPLGMTRTWYNPPKDLWANIQPTENYTAYANHQLQGEVHDPNTYAMGGISGHAGVFSTVDDVAALVRRWLYAGETDDFLNKTTTELWTTQADSSLSSRALGWNTNADNADDQGWSHSCGSLSFKSFMHIGYTGTIICADPERGIGTVLLCSRVYPEDTGSVYSLRSGFNTMVQKLWDSQ